jgi:hypothetical protein
MFKRISVARILDIGEFNLDTHAPGSKRARALVPRNRRDQTTGAFILPKPDCVESLTPLAIAGTSFSAYDTMNFHHPIHPLQPAALHARTRQ